MLLAAIALFTPPQASGDEASVRWLHPSIGSSSARSGFLILDRQPFPEVVLSSGNSFLHTLTYSPREQDLSHGRFLATPGDECRDMALGNVRGSLVPEIVRLHYSGLVDIVNAEDFVVVGSFMPPTQDTYAIAVADTDGDHHEEILVTSTGQLYVFDGATGAMLWSFNGGGGKDLVTGEMDGDPSVEIAVGNGYVIDAFTRQIQWTWNPGNYTVELAVADIDQDALDELVTMTRNYGLTAFNVDTGSTLWQLPTQATAFRFVDLQDDGQLELLHMDAISSYYVCSDALTLIEQWRLYIDEGEANDIAVVDFDRDGTKELLWSAGDSQSRVQVMDWRTGVVLWEHGPVAYSWIGPELGDLDHDGKPELVTASLGRNNGQEFGFMTVFHLDNDDPIASSGPVPGGRSSGGVFSMALRDVDQNGDDEIVIGTDESYDATIEIYDYAAGVFTRQWTNGTLPPGTSFRSIEAADLDLDGDVEIIGGVRLLHSGAAGVRLYAYDYPSGVESWRSLVLGTQGSQVLQLRVGDTDGDGYPNIVALMELDSIYVFDGRTKALQAIFFGDYSAVNLAKGPGAQAILAGTGSGELEVISYVGSSYVSAGKLPLGVGFIDGITPSSLTGRAWIGAQGRVHLMQLSSGHNHWSSDYFGELFGERVVELGRGLRGFASASSFGVVGFIITGP